MKGEIELRFPETVQTDTLDFIDHHRDDMQPRVPSAPLARIWRREMHGALSFEWKYDNQTVGGRLIPGYFGVDLEFRLENRRSEGVPVGLQFCPILRGTIFDDRSLDRTWIHTGGRWRKMSETDRGAGRRSLCHYPVEGGPKLVLPLP